MQALSGDGHGDESARKTGVTTPGTPTSCAPNPGDLWCGVIRVEERSGAYGYHEFEGVGNLSDTDFDVGMNSYTITIISVTEQGLPEGSGSGSLSFWIDPLPDSAGKAELAQLALHLDNDVFKLGEAPEQRPGFYYWPVSVSGVNLDWSQQDYVILRLREASSGDSSPARVAEPLTAAFEGLPEAHDGETAFTFRIVFSEAVSVTPEAMLTHVLTVDGGTVTGAARVDGETGVWDITVTPDTREALSISLPPVPNCDADGAVCTPDRRALSIWAAAIVTGPADQPESNTAATGTPTISGTPQVGGTLTADTKGIADEDGLENAAFSYQWLADDADIPGATESTYTLSEAVEGKAISVRVSFTDDAGNAELLTSEDTDAWSATMTVEWVYQGYGYYSTDTKKAGSLSPASFEVDGTTYTVKMVETQGWWMYIGVDRELPFDFVLELDGVRFASGDASFRSYSYGNIYRWEGTGLSLRDGDTVEVRLHRAFEDETAVNSAATGAPTISGPVQVGETLTADTSGIEDADGLDNAAFGYQWLADAIDISGATGSTYTLADADEGKAITVQVSFTDDAGNDETLTSAATDAVSAAPPENNEATGAPSISGTAQVGETLTVDTSGIVDADGLTNATFTYQWLADDADIAGATGSTYTLADADENKAIKVKVSFTDDAGNDETLTSAATDAVAAAPPENNEATGAPSISGTAQVGETLTVDTSGIADTDGLENSAFTYQWLADDTAIQGAMGSSYTLADAEEGKAITVQVSFTDDAGHDETLTSAATDAVAAAPASNTPATGAPTVSGTAQVGETLTAGTSGIVDADGLTNADFTYQWLAGDDAIPGATGSAYTLADADEGKAIMVQVSFTDDAGHDETLTSEATDAVAAAPQPNNPATGAPAISGTAQVGETLTADTSGVADEDGLDNAAFTYQWLAGDSDIAGAAGSTYTPVEADEGKTVKVRVSFTDDGGNDETLTSAATEAVAGNEEPVAREDVAAWSATMTVEWVYQGYGYYSTDAKKAGSLSPASFEVDGTTYTVKMVETQGWMYIGVDQELPFDFVLELDGARFASGDASFRSYSYGNIYRWERTGLRWRDGDAVEVRLLRAFEDETAVNSAATGAPTISGTVQVGETLTADTSGIADEDGLDNAAFTYRWLADNAAIAGATGSTYTLADADEGKAITVQVSFTDDAGNDETLTSAATDAVSAAPASNTPATGAPTVSGTAQVGETLTAGTSGIVDADGLTNATFNYQWLADDADIAGATGSTYTLVEADEGKTVKVRVSFTDDGGNDETLTSAATDAVAAPEPPAKPTCLSATPSHDRVVLTWDDPNDDTITGYVILRRNRDTDAQGQFTELAPDTGTAATTYTDDTVAAETPYTYRIKAINAHGSSERSRWFHIDTLAGPEPTQEPTPEPTPEPESVSEGDADLPNDNSTPGRVAVGGSATGAIGTAGDQDRFAVELVAGRTYQFDLTGSPGGGGTLPDTFFRAIYNSEGQYQSDSYNDDFDGGRDSRVTFTATESGTYYARVSGDRDEVGSYTLSVTDVTQ